MDKDLSDGRQRRAGAFEPSVARGSSGVGIYLYWIPLGAGGSGFVRLNGRIYEALQARIHRRRPLDLYHTALEVRLPEGRFIIETMWPSPDGDRESRGVVVEGAVGSHWMARIRLFRYEIRRWQDGLLPDADQAIGGPQHLSDDPMIARRLLQLVGTVPALMWGRDELDTGDMWNSNSVVSWLLAGSGLPPEAIRAPEGGRAPGWDAGLAIASDRPWGDSLIGDRGTSSRTSHSNNLRRGRSRPLLGCWLHSTEGKERQSGIE